jgi:hypothetical protein
MNVWKEVVAVATDGWSEMLVFPFDLFEQCL